MQRRKASAKRIFIFKSEAGSELHAFAGDSAGTKLPKKHGPWTAIGVIRPDVKPPHNFSRTAIETAIDASGFQLWRFKKAEQPKPKVQSKAKAPSKTRVQPKTKKAA